MNSGVFYDGPEIRFELVMLKVLYELCRPVAITERLDSKVIL
jgi:hypothetical protein